MKKHVVCLLFALLLLFKTTTAQIKFEIETKAVQCNHSALGKAKVIITNGTPPYSYQWSNGQNSSSIENLEIGVYTVIISDAIGNDTTLEISIGEVACEMDPEIVFTPNGDGYNDSWFITNTQYFDNALILVYNRWGQIVYRHRGRYDDPWDGRDIFGTPLPDAAYFFIVYKDKKDEKAIKKGNVSIVR